MIALSHNTAARRLSSAPLNARTAPILSRVLDRIAGSSVVSDGSPSESGSHDSNENLAGAEHGRQADSGPWQLQSLTQAWQVREAKTIISQLHTPNNRFI